MKKILPVFADKKTRPPEGCWKSDKVTDNFLCFLLTGIAISALYTFERQVFEACLHTLEDIQYYS